MSAREIWIQPLGDAARRKQVAVCALEEGFTSVVLERADDVVESLGRLRIILREPDALSVAGAHLGPVLTVEKPDDLAAVQALRGQALTVLLCCPDWKVIPLENLLADFQGTPTRVVAEATTVPEALALLDTLEVGTDGVVFRTGDPAEVRTLASRLQAGAAGAVPLVPCEVISVDAVRVGDRVCVDTASLLREGEGMLVGSQCSALVLVEAEVHASGYVAARPFRINAGPVHSYTLIPGGRTRYLSELTAGEEVLIVDRDGRTRSELVGRVKVERRPLLLIRFCSEAGAGSLLAQNAETVRLVTESQSVSVAALAVGQHILVHYAPKARHFGRAIEESIREA